MVCLSSTSNILVCLSSTSNHLPPHSSWQWQTNLHGNFYSKMRTRYNTLFEAIRKASLAAAIVPWRGLYKHHSTIQEGQRCQTCIQLQPNLQHHKRLCMKRMVNITSGSSFRGGWSQLALGGPLLFSPPPKLPPPRPELKLEAAEAPSVLYILISAMLMGYKHSLAKCIFFQHMNIRALLCFPYSN
jgi:hypothetical protein